MWTTGGVCVYGVSEDEHKATGFDVVYGCESTVFPTLSLITRTDRRRHPSVVLSSPGFSRQSSVDYSS